MQAKLRYRRTSKFKRDYKRESRTYSDLEELLRPVINHLVEGMVLPEQLKDHPLKGNLNDHRECHVKPNLILIYKRENGVVTLTRIGSHSELFG
ncbi:MAG: type II toxin-antitoxin system YafQ family toxin [Rhodobacteraceae bacterium]|nr:type II toxin-antitoxin system YafQ family toxin [Paracoccaceae bacterium]